MATDLSPELSQFQEFIVNFSKSGSSPASLDEAVVEFREYQRQLADLKEKIREAEESSARGESRPFDAEATKKWLRERLAQEGIVE